MISTVKVAAVQMNSLPYDKAGNLALAEGLVRQAAEAGAKLVVLPELFNTGYQVADQDYALSEPVPGGETVRWMEELSVRHQLYLVAAIIERSACEGVLYDTCVLTGPEGYVGKYRKVCLWGAESLRFRSGHEYPVFDLGFARLGMQICYEVGFPEGARILTLNGANLLAYSAAFGRRRSYVWELASRARALENGLYVVAANRSGAEGEESVFAAKSRIVDPTGAVLEETEAENGIIVTEIDLDRVPVQRMTVPYLRDYKQQLFANGIGGV